MVLSEDTAFSIAFASQLSSLFGWVYFIAWSMSFYPQPILNWQRKSVAGLSREYLIYNITGFIFYALFTTVQYEAEATHNLPRTVAYNDIAFSMHAIVLTVLTIAQLYQYRTSLKDAPPLDSLHLALCTAFWVLGLAHIVLASQGYLLWVHDAVNPVGYTAVQYFGFAKAAISCVKYIPQVYINYQLKSTLGWAVGTVITDMTGGIFSILQQVCDAYVAHGGSDGWFGFVFSDNLPKLILASESCFFDAIFLVQHYILYPHSHAHLAKADAHALDEAAEAAKPKPLDHEAPRGAGPSYQQQPPSQQVQIAIRDVDMKNPDESTPLLARSYPSSSSVPVSRHQRSLSLPLIVDPCARPISRHWLALCPDLEVDERLMSLSGRSPRVTSSLSAANLSRERLPSSASSSSGDDQGDVANPNYPQRTRVSSRPPGKGKARAPISSRWGLTLDHDLASSTSESSSYSSSSSTPSPLHSTQTTGVR